MTITDQPRPIPGVPSEVSGALRQWLQTLTDHLNTQPTFSVFSFTSPNSNVTANAGTIGQNLKSGVSGVWMKQLGSSNTGWVPIA